MTFDYCAPAELFMAKRKGGPRQRLGYRRFVTAAEAIRFAVEDFPFLQCVPSARGCRSGTSASTARIFTVYMRGTINRAGKEALKQLLTEFPA